MGGVIIGDGLSVTPTGLLSATASVAADGIDMLPSIKLSVDQRTYSDPRITHGTPIVVYLRGQRLVGRADVALGYTTNFTANTIRMNFPLPSDLAQNELLILFGSDTAFYNPTIQLVDTEAIAQSMSSQFEHVLFIYKEI